MENQDEVFIEPSGDRDNIFERFEQFERWFNWIHTTCDISCAFVQKSAKERKEERKNERTKAKKRRNNNKRQLYPLIVFSRDFI